MPNTTVITVFDSQGGAHKVPILLEKADSDTWIASLRGAYKDFTDSDDGESLKVTKITEDDGSVTTIKMRPITIIFNQDGTFSAKFAGTGMSGNYTFDEATSKVTMQGMLLTINAYIKRNSNGIALLFESSKLLSLLQAVSALSGNSTIQTVGELSKNYDGLRLGFDFK